MALGRLFLTHWNETEAHAYSQELQEAGWHIEWESEDGGRAVKTIKASQPDVVVIYLTRLPSHGREIGDALRSIKTTRGIPIVFVGGQGKALVKTMAKVPEAIFTIPEDLGVVLKRFEKEDSLETKVRCAWVGTDPLYVAYHDVEWGLPVHDDRRLFEFLILEGAQAGLSWATILRKRENYRLAFDRFDPQIVARYDAEKVEQLLSNAGIVRNRRKIEAAIQNARAFLEVQQEFGHFAAYMWGFVGGKPKVNAWTTVQEIPAQSEEAVALSKDLIRRGFRFVGPTICYAHMQAVGMVNDHTGDCFRYEELQALGRNG